MVRPSIQQVREQIIGCQRCPRLRAYCERVATEKKRVHRHETYWGKPVPGFGDPAARVLIVGLAPAAHGANRTGRMFTGDGSGDFLMTALHATGVASLPTSRRRDDGLWLNGAYILAAVRCAPPDNKPTPAEIDRCHHWLMAEFGLLGEVRVIVALGKIAFDACLRLLHDRGVRWDRKPRFAHACVYDPGPAWPSLVGSYHPSRQNTNTGRLTSAMLTRVFELALRRAQRDERTFLLAAGRESTRM